MLFLYHIQYIIHYIKSVSPGNTRTGYSSQPHKAAEIFPLQKNHPGRMPRSNAEDAMCNSPKYMQVKQSLLNKIQNKELLPGERLESESEFAQRYQVSMITIRKALSELANEGYLNRTKGKGTFVAYPSASSRRLVALTISCKDYQDSSVLQIIRGAQRILSDFQYAMIVEWNQSGPEEELAIIQKLITQGVEGFLIYPFDPVPSTSNYQIIDKKGIPYVLIDRYNPDYKTRFAG